MSLANTVMAMANAVVKQTEGQLNQSSATLQEILKAGANERGEWHLPLTEQELQSMQQVCDLVYTDALSPISTWMHCCLSTATYCCLDQQLLFGAEFPTHRPIMLCSCCCTAGF